MNEANEPEAKSYSALMKRIGELKAERDELLNDLHAKSGEHFMALTERDEARRERDEARAERSELLADVGCYVATRSFWPLSLREAIKRHDVEAVKAETERAEAQVKKWLEDSHALADATALVDETQRQLKEALQQRDEARAKALEEAAKTVDGLDVWIDDDAGRRLGQRASAAIRILATSEPAKASHFSAQQLAELEGDVTPFAVAPRLMTKPAPTREACAKVVSGERTAPCAYACEREPTCGGGR